MKIYRKFYIQNCFRKAICFNFVYARMLNDAERVSIGGVCQFFVYVDAREWASRTCRVFC